MVMARLGDGRRWVVVIVATIMQGEKHTYDPNFVRFRFL